MRKTILTIITMIMIIITIYSATADSPGDLEVGAIITPTEFLELSNGHIHQLVYNDITYTGTEYGDEEYLFRFKLRSIEPTHNANKDYMVIRVPFVASLPYYIINICLTENNLNSCYGQLVNSNSPYQYQLVNEEGETTTFEFPTIKMQLTWAAEQIETYIYNLQEEQQNQNDLNEFLEAGTPQTNI